MSVACSSACLTALVLLTCSSAGRPPTAPRPERLLGRLLRKEREAGQQNRLNASALNTALAFGPYRDLATGGGAGRGVPPPQQQHQNNILFSPSGLASALALLCRVSGPESRGRALEALGMAANSTQQSVEANLQRSRAFQEGGAGGGSRPEPGTAAGIGGASARAGNRSRGRTDDDAHLGAQLRLWSSLHVDGKPSLDYDSFLSRPPNTELPAFNSSFETLMKDLKGSNKLILKNFVYFKGVQPFDRRHTVLRSFHLNASFSVEVAMMFRDDASKVTMLYDTNCSATVVRLAFSERLASLLLLPKGELRHLEDCLSDSRMSFWLSNLKPGRAEILLPKFQLRKSYSLKTLLKNVGVSSVFSGASQAKMPKIIEAPHEVMLEVEESRSEEKRRPNTLLDFSVPQRITFDRPFMLIIYDDLTGIVQLIGRITDPTDI
ncbi:alpha-1-antitrypsin-like protein CM55-MS [Cololabis saira]|uniref:alpha-1-antitrypsin-like protein CM55-MS n=1 Tax=Cololabis saira TaxID=129043 RepID=UPI002AD3C09D|nr:alpha-1-antitrypsin-like protein CM55-MS [Cololabis saira]